MITEITENEILHGQNAPHRFREVVHGSAGGKAVVTFSDRTAHRLNLDLAASLLSSLGTLLSIYPSDGCWSDLGVRLDADPIRTHGTGENPLHIDLVDREFPPKYIALYCIRNDPHGGGATMLSDLWAAYGGLAEEDRSVLSEDLFSYWTDEGAHGVGNSLPTFPVLPSALRAGTVIRFTGKMATHLHHGLLADPTILPAASAAFDRLVEHVNHHALDYLLKPGQMIVFDQRRYAHGRRALGHRQDRVDVDSRRLLKQAYVSGWEDK
ncbi:TauD/TfdA family dioxygenase [Nocardia gipuzkoensis]